MLGTLANVAVWLLLAVSIVIIGWDEPLRYKFMSREQVAEAESIYRPIPKKKPDFRDWKGTSTAVDLYPTQNGGRRR